MSHHSISITLNDVEIYFHKRSIRITRGLEERGTAQFRIRETKGAPRAGQKIGIFDKGLRIFGGTINSVTRSPIADYVSGGEPWYDVIVTSWEHRLERHKISAASYYDMDAGQIINTLMDELFDNYGEEIQKGTIDNGASAEAIGVLKVYGRTYLDVMQELAERSNYILYIDPDLFLHFVPRDWSPSSMPITKTLANYRFPEIKEDRADYYNAASMSISLEAFTPLSLSLAGDLTYPSFVVYDPADSTQTPLPVEAIRTINIRGVPQEFGVYGSDTNKVFYYTPGRPEIYWDALEPVPTAADTVTVEFWYVGQNVVRVEDTAEQAALLAVEGTGSARYHAHLEDFDELDATVATNRLNAFLDQHCPSRNGGAAGEWPKEYRFTVYSLELIDPVTLQWAIYDLMPGRKILFHPSTPIDEEVWIIITKVIVQDIEDRQFRYDVTGVPFVRTSDDFLFYQALAEVPPGRPKTDLTIEKERHNIVFVVPGTISVGDDVTNHAELSLKTNEIFRCREAYVNAKTVPTSDLLIDCEYSTDPYDTPYASRTWNPFFQSSAGDLVLPAGQMQRQYPLRAFAAEPLDIPKSALCRMNVKAGDGAAVKAQIVGDMLRTVSS